ncbi:MAG TPA: hypothetical protein VLF63_03020 [Patescibacteria group bacterium]|nr:hypothetical protein [Patescibacteria group bacterium]
MYAVVFHAHQKLDRLAYDQLKKIIKSDSFFPDIEDIIGFEGKKGPDSTKLKKGGGLNQPWHFVDPHKRRDKDLIKEIGYHFDQLTLSLKKKDEIRSAFEAAWLAHALVDGLTPAHHYPYKKELQNIHGLKEERNFDILDRAYVKTGKLSKSIAQSLKLIGPKGLITTHALFEAGAYFMTAPNKFKVDLPTEKELKIVKKKGISKMFKNYLKDVAKLDIYDRYSSTGWTKDLKRDFKDEVLPRMIRIVTLSWYSAFQKAGL